MTNGLETQNLEPEAKGCTVHGVVKWFDPTKGFGFVVADQGGPDILLHINVLRNYGQSSVADGARVEIETQQTERGVQVAQILSISPPEDLTSAAVNSVCLDPEALAKATLEPARVKWFDRTKGFGFANVFGSQEDVFLHIDVLRQSGLAELQAGEALALRVVDGERGQLAGEVRAWETVTRK